MGKERTGAAPPSRLVGESEAGDPLGLATSRTAWRGSPVLGPTATTESVPVLASGPAVSKRACPWFGVLVEESTAEKLDATKSPVVAGGPKLTDALSPAPSPGKSHRESGAVGSLGAERLA
jgi:hypothetical protein